MKPASDQVWDHIIVGAGSAGCVLANRLSADPDVSVLLLEAGGKDNWIWIHIPVGYLFCIGNPRTDWCYRTEPEPGLNGRSIMYARGRVLGDRGWRHLGLSPPAGVQPLLDLLGDQES